MRLRNVTGSREVIAESRFVVPEETLKEMPGKWQALFGNENPIHIEIGMGKGQFLHAMAKEHPEICDRAAHYLLDWFDGNMMSSRSGHDPMQTVLREGGPFHTRGELAGYVEYLRRTDRSEEAERLIARHPDEL